MRREVKRRSNAARTLRRSSSGSRLMARKASCSLSTMKPVTPSSMTSGTEPRRKAMTGVPHAMASIITKPKGSGQSIGNSSAVASRRNASLVRSLTSPLSLICWPSISGSNCSLK